MKPSRALMVARVAMPYGEYLLDAEQDEATEKAEEPGSVAKKIYIYDHQKKHEQREIAEMLADLERASKRKKNGGRHDNGRPKRTGCEGDSGGEGEPGDGDGRAW